MYNEGFRCTRLLTPFADRVFCRHVNFAGPFIHYRSEETLLGVDMDELVRWCEENSLHVIQRHFMFDEFTEQRVVHELDVMTDPSGSVLFKLRWF